MPGWSQIQQALDAAADYYGRLYFPITGPNNEEWGCVKEGPGCPVAVYNASTGSWRYPGKRNAFKGEDTKIDGWWTYRCEDRDFADWAWPDFDDLVFKIRHRYVSANSVRWEIEVLERNGADTLHLYLSDTLLTIDPYVGWTYDQIHPLGKLSTCLQYPPRYQRCMGRMLKELGYITEGDRVIAFAPR